MTKNLALDVWLTSKKSFSARQRKGSYETFLRIVGFTGCYIGNKKRYIFANFIIKLVALAVVE